MKAKHIGLGFLGIVIVAAIVFAGGVITTYNGYTRLENKAEAAQNDNNNVLDNTRKLIREAAAVSEKEVEALTSIITGYAEARGPNPDGGDGNIVSMGMVTEAVPGVTDIKTLRNLQNIVVAGRKDWQNAQTRLLDIKRQADNKLETFPGNVVLGFFGKEEIAVTIVTSSETEGNFASGKDESNWIK